LKTTTVRKAFTLIEVLVSVLILSVSFIYILKIHSDNQHIIAYMLTQTRDSLEDSLFLPRSDILRYDKRHLDAYEIQKEHFRSLRTDDHEILKEVRRNIVLSEAKTITEEEMTGGPRVEIRDVYLKENTSSIYTHIWISF